MPETIPGDVATRPATTPRLVPRQRGADRPEPRNRLSALDWVVPALLTAGLGIWRLTTPALWADELATWGAVRISWDELWQLSRAVDVVLTPYYAAMKAYVAVAGDSTAALRLPSVIAMTATTLVVVALGRRLGGRGTGFTAGLIVATLPVTSRYAQEARPYAVTMLAAALAILCLIRLLEKPEFGRAAAYAGAILLAALSHPLSALLMLTAHTTAVVIRRTTRRGGATWLGATLPGGLCAVLLMGRGYRSRTQISWIDHLSLSGFQVIPDRLFLSGAVGGIVLGLAVIAVRRETVTVAAAAFVPMLALLAADQFTPIWVARYVLVAVPPLTVLAAYAALHFGRTQAAALVAVTVALGFPAQLNIREPAGHGADSTKVAAVIAPAWRPGDVVLFPDSHRSIPWAPRDMYDRYMPASRPPDILQTERQRADGHFLAEECPAASCLGEPARIWVVRVDSPADPFRDMSRGKAERLRERYRPVQRWSYDQVGITLLERIP